VNENPELDENFARLIVHLGQMAALYFGDLPDPGGQPMEPDIPAAGQVIEIIAAVQAKTQGNLTPTEAKVLDDLLYELRMRYVEAQQGGRRIITP